MMRPLIVVFVLLLLGCQGSPSQSVADSAGFVLTRGEPWKGVKLGDQPLRTSTVICQRSQCFRLNGPVNLPVELLRKYQLSSTDFKAYAAAPGVERKGDQLTLPYDLGWQLFSEARRRAMRESREDVSLWLLD